MGFFDFFRNKDLSSLNNDLQKGISESIDKPLNTQDVKDIPLSQTDGGKIMNPGQPRDETTDLAQLFQYQGNFNQAISPRAYEDNSFEELRFLAKNPLIRSCIQLRKDQIYSLDFEIKNVNDETKVDERCMKVKKLLKNTSTNFNSWRSFISAVVEDMLVCDAVAIRLNINPLDGEVRGLDMVDASKVSIKINSRGEIPKPPEIAYQTTFSTNDIKNYHADQLIYIKTNGRSDSVYGYSLVEQVFDIIELYLLRQMNVKSYLTEGNLPDSMIQAPEKWLPSQVAQYQQYWNNLYSQGNMISKKQRVKFVPHGMELIQSKSPELKQDIDEFLARQICAVFGVPPTAYTKDTNKATASTLNEMSKDSSLRSLVKNIEEEMTRIIQHYLGYEDLEFVFKQEQNSDGLKEAQEINLYLSSGVFTRNEARKRLGYAPVEGGDVFFENTTSATGENRQPGQKDPQSQEVNPNAELENPNELR